jgi:hypothetical protein
MYITQLIRQPPHFSHEGEGSMFLRSVSILCKTLYPEDLNDYGREDPKKYWRFLVTEILDLERQHVVSR